MYILLSVLLVFFVQAEDDIRYGHVTGVQTCALPILSLDPASIALLWGETRDCRLHGFDPVGADPRQLPREHLCRAAEIGRASCRERVARVVDGEEWKRKKHKGRASIRESG